MENTILSAIILCRTLSLTISTHRRNSENTKKKPSSTLSGTMNSEISNNASRSSSIWRQEQERHLWWRAVYFFSMRNDIGTSYFLCIKYRSSLKLGGTSQSTSSRSISSILMVSASMVEMYGHERSRHSKNRMISISISCFSRLPSSIIESRNQERIDSRWKISRRTISSSSPMRHIDSM